MSRTPRVRSHADPGSARLAPWLAALAGWALVLWVFWPGYMSWDSAYQWWQARHDQFDSVHPPLLAMIWQLTDRVVEGPGGMFALQCALEQHFSGNVALERIVELVTHAPAQLFQVAERGYLREGYKADLVLVDPNTPHTVRREEVLSRCGWSPFEGHTFRSSIASTWVNGRRVWDGSRIDDSVRGERLAFAR